ncbi:FadR family transcriptional regulator [Spiractinospora alimapuensis]|uniref:FadR/GntR family transcriptional regulator n=1 Tax=Spiractinospora alimapuensis TaxID=2820884 RepID=UPI001F291F2B|nr:FadR/GntR family transcriptional regulator [Spiractinospora alimapuensis]QVQ50828.1 FadR family transcriptional regulator [Spiractinospora alimapuensis]
MPEDTAGAGGSRTAGRPVGVAEDAINRLKDRIGSGEFPPGQRLPAEAELSATLGVSRLSLREAVRALVVAGVLEVRHGAGTFVTDLRPDRMVDAIGRFLELAGDGGYLELMECRRVIEPGATALAAPRIEPELLASLREQIDTMREMTDPTELVEADLRFHAEIAAASGNPTLAALSTSVARRTDRARVWRAMVAEHVTEQTHQQHLAIHAALTRRDSLAAFTAATAHIQTVEEWIAARLSTNG